MRQSQRAEELEGVLAGVKVKVQGLEDSIISKAAQQQGHFQLLQQDKRDAEVPRPRHPSVLVTCFTLVLKSHAVSRCTQPSVSANAE